MRNIKVKDMMFTTRDSVVTDKYINEVSRISLLTGDDEVKLARLAREGDESAMNQLVTANLRFVISVAKRYQVSNMSIMDLISEGNIGLMTAARNFDERRGFRFISYAVWHIRQRIYAFVNENDMIGVSSHKKAMHRKIKARVTMFQQTHDREPSFDELSEIVGVETDVIRECLADMSMRLVSTSASMPGFAEFTMEIGLTDETGPRPDDSFRDESMRTDVIRLMSSVLNPRENSIVRMYYGIECREMSITEISWKLNLTSERIRQIMKKIMCKLRHGRNSKMRYVTL